MESKKNPEVSIEKKKLSLVFMGLIVSSSLMLWAFESKTFTKELGERTVTIVEEEDDEDVEEYVQPEQPEPPPPPPPAPPEEIELIEDDDEKEETETPINVPEDDEEPVIIVKKKKEVVDDNIFDIVEDQPEFPGGLAALKRYLGKKS